MCIYVGTLDIVLNLLNLSSSQLREENVELSIFFQVSIEVLVQTSSKPSFTSYKVVFILILNFGIKGGVEERYETKLF